MVTVNKSILFTCGELKLGGVEKSLIALMKTIDYQKYIVTLMLPTKAGELLDQIPKQVEIIIAPEIISTPKFTKSTFKKDVVYILKNLDKATSFIKAAYYAIKTNSKIARQMYWSFVKDKIKNQKAAETDYDIAISYAGGIGIWNQLIIDKINAKMKICWIHGNYAVFGTGTELEKDYMKKFDSIVTVSDIAKDILIKEIPELKEKITVIHNIINKKYITELAEKESVYNDSFDGIRFVSISRLDKGKGFDIAIKAFYRAIQDGHNLKWDIIGDGYEKESLLKLIVDLNLTDRVRLMGKKLNPYPYLKGADVFIHPSKGEGKSMAVDEAKLMAKPILITAYPTIKDQIENDITGRIVQISEDGIYKGIVEMALNDGIRKRLSNNLKDFIIDTKSIQKVERILSSS